jgi:antitoxin VapB
MPDRAGQMCIRFVYTENMATTRVFRSGNSQAVRIPREFRFRSKEVEISRRGGEVVLREKQRNLAAAFELLAGLSDDFFRGRRKQPKATKRPKL